MKQILIEFISFESPYKAIIHFKHRQPLTVTSDRGGAAYLVAELLRPIQGVSGRLTAYEQYAQYLRSLEDTCPGIETKIPDTPDTSR